MSLHVSRVFASVPVGTCWDSRLIILTEEFAFDFEVCLMGKVDPTFLRQVTYVFHSKNILHWSAVVFCACGIKQIFSVLFKPAALQIGRSMVRFQMVSIEYFIDIKSFRSHYGPGVDSASNRNEYQEYFLGGKSGRCVRLTTLPPSWAIVT